MASVNISEAARLTGKGRSTIQRHIKYGKLSASRDASGNPAIDTSELVRVYGAIQAHESLEVAPTTQGETPTVELLKEQLRQAHEREEWLKQRIEILEQRALPPGEKKGLWARIFS